MIPRSSYSLQRTMIIYILLIGFAALLVASEFVLETHSAELKQELTSNFEQFTSYQEALEYAENLGTTNYSIVGSDPFTSPVSLEAVQNYKLVYSSESGISTENTVIPEVKIFEYTK